MNTLSPFLAAVIENGSVVEEAASSGHGLFAAICLIIGVFNLLCPYAAWYLTHGWKFRDAEPSDLALLMARVGGGICILIGIIYFVI